MFAVGIFLSSFTKSSISAQNCHVLVMVQMQLCGLFMPLVCVSSFSPAVLPPSLSSPAFLALTSGSSWALSHIISCLSSQAFLVARLSSILTFQPLFSRGSTHANTFTLLTFFPPASSKLGLLFPRISWWYLLWTQLRLPMCLSQFFAITINPWAMAPAFMVSQMRTWRCSRLTPLPCQKGL